MAALLAAAEEGGAFALDTNPDAGWYEYTRHYYSQLAEQELVPDKKEEAIAALRIWGNKYSMFFIRVLTLTNSFRERQPWWRI